MRATRLVLLLFALLPAALAVLITGTTPECTGRVCHVITSMPHTGLNGTRSVVPLYVWYAKKTSFELFQQRRPLALLLPGGLVRAVEYARFARLLAARGYAVVIPQYTARRVPVEETQRAIDASRAAGYDCPRNGVLVSARLIISVGDFLAARAPQVWLRDTLLMGHSFGATVVTEAFFGGCDGRSRERLLPLFFDFFCEGYRTPANPRIRVRMIALFDMVLQYPIQVPANVLMLHVVSPFYSEARREADFNRFIVGSSRARVAEIVLKNGTNHFMINDYVPETRHAKTVCALDRSPPQDRFTSTRAVQQRVVRSCADVVIIAYNAFISGFPVVRTALPFFESFFKISKATFLG